MPDVQGGVMPGEAVADTQGPSASMPYGARAANDRLQGELTSLGGRMGGGMPGAQPAGPAGAPGSGGAPVQPAPQRPTMTPQGVNQVFSPPQQVSYPWQAALAVAGLHPTAGPYLRALGALAARGFGPNGNQPAQQS